MTRAPETRPLRLVLDEPRPRIRQGRGSVLGPDTSRRTCWWEVTLECGHVAEPRARFTPADPPWRYRGGKSRSLADLIDVPPKRARCDYCPPK